ncbi:hypothetical protein HMJ29_16940 [Hymenobacter taeanensis]|uniref:Uncharacterized protein n=1 Tax=Hymenobacter taeanensis TaxID=2735321 RepID=A0A6M6BKM5_9BACT|nr:MULTISPECIES: hypothetical protein [Hymenobacter]QJX48509.1 hypothetical protein HMJ29_16940 [Hymenobacter taeanensis]UOQ81992.1 hypothetical protein MUN83_04175 [Hymenobacter sp. 5414T-23]
MSIPPPSSPDPAEDSSAATGPPPAEPGTPHPTAQAPQAADGTPLPLGSQNSGFFLLPPPPPEQFTVVRSEDGRMALTNDTLEVNGQAYGWRELAGVDVQPVRWLLWFLLGGFILAGFMLGFLQNWLRTIPAAAGMALGALLLAFGTRGSNRWRLHRPGQEAVYFALSGAARSWQQLAAEANRRIRKRHDEAAAADEYWLQSSWNASQAAKLTSSPSDLF